MPYLNQERINYIINNKDRAHEEGDWNYFYTLAITDVFGKTPRYKTVHLLKKACYVASNWVPEILKVDEHLRKINVPAEDIKSARMLAFDEFYRRVAAKYEDKKIRENGDVYDELLNLVEGE